MASISELLPQVTPETRELVRDLLEQEVGDGRVTAQVGPALTQADTARLLNKSLQAVSKDRALLRLDTRDGRVVYPVAQFKGRALRPGITEVVRHLRESFEPLTVALWLTGDNPDLDGRPIDALDEGRVEEVMAAAAIAARAAA